RRWKPARRRSFDAWLNLGMVTLTERGPARLRRTTAGTTACLVAAIMLLGPGPSADASTPTGNCGAGGVLQAKLAAVAPGSTILVRGTCLGNFGISGKGLTLKGNPSATLDGNDLGPTLAIDAAGKVVHLVGVTVTGGTSDSGGGITKTAGAL